MWPGHIPVQLQFSKSDPLARQEGISWVGPFIYDASDSNEKLRYWLIQFQTVVAAIDLYDPGSFGILMRSTNATTLSGGAGVKRETTVATAKLSSIPKVPIPSGDIPNHQ